HGVVWHECSYFALVLMDSARNLQRGQHQAAGGMQHQVDGNIWIRQMDSSQHFLGIVNIDVPKHGEAQNAHGLLPVDKQDHTRFSLPLDLRDERLARGMQRMLLKRSVYGGTDKEQR